jgi:hypothetical protein
MCDATLCKRGFLFTTLTLLTIGVSAALFILLVYYFIHLGIQTAEEAVFAILVVAMCVSVLLLFYGFWASACGRKAAKISLAVIYLVYGLVLLAIGIALLALKSNIIDTVQSFFVDKPVDDKVRTAFEKEFDCKWTPEPETETDCKKKFQDLYGSFGVGIAAGLIVLFALLLVGDIIAWRWLCNNWEDVPEAAKQPTMTSPLTYSW